MVKKVRVTILDDRNRKGCAEHCGADWSSAEVIALARQSIKDRFEEGIELVYLDLSDPTVNNRVTAPLEEIVDRYQTLPVLTVNGKVRIAGHFDIRQLLEVIETELEVNSEQQM